MRTEPSSAGHDSFLDIVANLVGILIILVVVVGAQAATVWQRATPETALQIEQLEERKQHAQAESNAAASMQMENKELHRKIEEEQHVVERLTAIRHKILVQLETGRQQYVKKKEGLDQRRQDRLNATAKIQALERELQQIRDESTALNHMQTSQIETIEHYPTPIAKTVFSDEIHFRVRRGRIVHVPLEELVDLMKNQWQIAAQKLNQGETASETVGPIGDFRLQYVLQTTTPDPRRSQYGIQLRRFALQPIRENIGEEISVALDKNSRFWTRLNRQIPEKTTVSLWVYPDGYEDLRAIRKLLRQAGYQTASWPLEFGRLISGGPQGFRTTTN